MSTPGVGGALVLAAGLLLVAVALLSAPGRRASAAVLTSVGRWPGLIRSELRGDAPLRAEAGPDAARGDTTPDLPAVRDDPPPPTRTFPAVDRPGPGAGPPPAGRPPAGDGVRGPARPR